MTRGFDVLASFDLYGFYFIAKYKNDRYNAVSLTKIYSGGSSPTSFSFLNLTYLHWRIKTSARQT